MKRTNFSSFWHGSHVEYVKNGNATSKDNYVIPWPWPKNSHQRFWQQLTFPVPAEQNFLLWRRGLAYYPLIKNREIVVKPKSTNFGLGISLSSKSQLAWKSLSQGSGDCFFRRCRRLSGGIYRWNGVPLLCLRRTMPSSPLASGGQCRRRRSAYRERIDCHQNDNPLRGRDHRSPLEIIELGTLNCSCWTSKAMDQMISCLLESRLTCGAIPTFLLAETRLMSQTACTHLIRNSLRTWQRLWEPGPCGVDLIIPDSSAYFHKGKSQLYLHRAQL